MKNKLKQRENKGRGPLAKKVIDSARQQLQRKITGLSDWKEGNHDKQAPKYHAKMIPFSDAHAISL